MSDRNKLPKYRIDTDMLPKDLVSISFDQAFRQNIVENPKQYSETALIYAKVFDSGVIPEQFQASDFQMTKTYDSDRTTSFHTSAIIDNMLVSRSYTYMNEDIEGVGDPTNEDMAEMLSRDYLTCCVHSEFQSFVSRAKSDEETKRMVIGYIEDNAHPELNPFISKQESVIPDKVEDTSMELDDRSDEYIAE